MCYVNSADLLISIQQINVYMKSHIECCTLRDRTSGIVISEIRQGIYFTGIKKAKRVRFNFELAIN